MDIKELKKLKKISDAAADEFDNIATSYSNAQKRAADTYVAYRKASDEIGIDLDEIGIDLDNP